MKRYTTFRAALYAIPLFLAPFAEKLVPLLFDGKWPSPQSVAACTIVGIIATCIGLRAYYDGSYQRSKDEQKPKP